jgi:predicted ATPase
MMTRRIVITGGPGTGKTALVTALEEAGYSCFHEIIREMTRSAKQDLAAKGPLANPLTFVDDPLSFNRAILKGRVAQFHSATELQEPFVFYDRGIPDVLAYMDYFDQAYDSEFTRPCRELRYDLAVLLPPWRRIYRQDGERMESFQQACEIHDCLADTYSECGYEVVSLGTGSVPKRLGQLLEIVAATDG